MQWFRRLRGGSRVGAWRTTHVQLAVTALCTVPDSWCLSCQVPHIQASLSLHFQCMTRCTGLCCLLQLMTSLVVHIGSGSKLVVVEPLQKIADVLLPVHLRQLL